MNNEELIAILEDALRADSVVQAINRLKAEAEPDFIEQVDANMIDFLRDALDVTSARIAELEAENQKLKDANRWIPVTQLPTKRGHYWCYIVFEPSTFYDNSREAWQREAWFDGKKWHSKWGVQRIKAWREIPEPYQEAK